MAHFAVEAEACRGVVRLRGAGAADTSVVHYQVWFLQNKYDN